MIMNEKQSGLCDLQHHLELLKSCLEFVKAKTRLLMRHDLTGLEAILVPEGELLERLSELSLSLEKIDSLDREGLSGECLLIRTEIKAVVEEIQVSNQTNARLIQNGQQFCEVLYGAICPPQTYLPSLSVVSRPIEATFQAQY